MNSTRTCVLEPVNVHDESSLWTTAQAAVVLNRSERSVRRLVSQGAIAGHKVRGKFGDEWRIMPFTTESNQAHHAKDTDDDNDDDFSPGAGQPRSLTEGRPSNKSCGAENVAINNESIETTEESGSTCQTVEARRKSVNTSRMAAVVMPEPSIWKSIISFLQTLLFWTARQEKMINQKFETQN